MSILIKGMKMPPVGRVLMVFPSGRVLEVSSDKIQDVYGDTEAVELPPHGRLIDGDVAEVVVYEQPSRPYEKDFVDGILYAADWIADQPTIIEAEGVSE